MKKTVVVNRERNPVLDQGHKAPVIETRFRGFVSFDAALVAIQSGYILTEDGDRLTTEGGDAFVTET